MYILWMINIIVVWQQAFKSRIILLKCLINWRDLMWRNIWRKSKQRITRRNIIVEFKSHFFNGSSSVSVRILRDCSSNIGPAYWSIIWMKRLNKTTENKNESMFHHLLFCCYYVVFKSFIVTKNMFLFLNRFICLYKIFGWL